jgi:biofilm PGA synthesis N-glycosyltransferase PgaC
MTATFFWISLSIVMYTYFGYGLFLWMHSKIFYRKKKLPEHFLPDVTLVVAAFNEEKVMRQKIENTMALNYPEDRLSLLFITDGSTDATNSIIHQYPRITVLHEPGRKGKTAALNKAMQHVQTSIVIFSDANTVLNRDCIRNIARHYTDEKIGGVSGEKKILQQEKASAAGAGEGIYWQYESLLKRMDSDFYTVVGAAGELFSIRTELYEPVEENVLLDDFFISVNVCLKGYRVVYEPAAIATEASSLSIREEQKRKVRISAGCFQAMLFFQQLLNPFRNFKLFFQYVSHRIFRWTVCPLFLPLILILNAWLFFSSGEMVYEILFLLQITFYLLAMLGWIAAGKTLKLKAFFIPYYFVFMNASVYLGFIRFLRKKQTVIWEKAEREA